MDSSIAHTGGDHPAMHNLHSEQKLHKQERHLRERLQEAQEAEARALDRLRRAQAKLERRQARVARLEHRLSQLRQAIESSASDASDMQSRENGYAAPETQPDGYNAFQEYATSSYLAIEPVEEIIIADAGDTIEPSFAAEPVEEMRLEAEPHVTPAFEVDEPEMPVTPVTPVIVDHQEQELLTIPTTPIPAILEPTALSPLSPFSHSISPEEEMQTASETLQQAEMQVQQARNRARDLAASITVLAQSDLSADVLDELLRKQSEANKALLEAQKSEFAARERLALVSQK